MRTRRAALALLGVGLLVGLGCSRRDPAALGGPGAPLAFMLSPAHGAALGEADRRELGRRLGEAAGLRVEVRVARRSGDTMAALASGGADLALLPLFDYLLCQRELGVVATLQLLRRDGRTTHTGELLVRAEGGPRTLAELAGRRVAFVDPYSTTGFLLPSKLLRDAGVRPEVVMTGGPARALAALREGRVAAAAVYSGAAAGDPGLTVLARTAEVPNEPVFFRKELDPERRRRLTEGLLALAGSAEGKALLSRLADATGLRPIDDQAYRPVFGVIRAAGLQVEDLVPKGWRASHELHRSLADYAP